MAEAYKYEQNSRIFSFANYAFDVFISDIFGGLLAGSTICIAPQHLVIANLSGLLNDSRSTHLNVTPSVAAMLLPDDLPFLESLVLTGEPATSALLKTWASRIYVVNSYGPTEAAVVTWGEVSPLSDIRCVGRAVRGMEVLVLNESLGRAPPGVQGTIYVGGSQLSLGYLDSPEARRREEVDELPISALSNGYSALIDNLIVEEIMGYHYEVFSLENIASNSQVIREALAKLEKACGEIES
ncbi:hypothetical protein GGR54DRAFT_645513 [Hypoxylon sp. NC1633]|nr:hypothetical protein GGR54DRAFT_645513 [Hypoxylon sp. NC1633]